MSGTFCEAGRQLDAIDGDANLNFSKLIDALLSVFNRDEA